MFSVAAINFLDNRFTPVAAGKIEIDVRPAFAALVQESFEDEMIFHRIDRRDSRGNNKLRCWRRYLVPGP